MAQRDLVVGEAGGGERIDAFLGKALGLSRAKLKALFEQGAVKVGGRRAKKGLKVEPGQQISIVWEEASSEVVPEPDAALEVLLETPDLVFVNKRAGRPSHPLQPGERGTVANALVARYPECAAASEDVREGGLCHRLDIQTSGVLLAARGRPVWERMRDAFGDRRVDKRYWALVTGPIADEGEIDLPLESRSDHVVPAPSGRPAQTLFRVLARSGEFSWIEARIVTGVLHQVRAHLAGIGAPVLGDTLYGGREEPQLGRFFLHARKLTVPGAPPVEAPLPGELSATLVRYGLGP